VRDSPVRAASCNPSMRSRARRAPCTLLQGFGGDVLATYKERTACATGASGVHRATNRCGRAHGALLQERNVGMYFVHADARA